MRLRKIPEPSRGTHNRIDLYRDMYFRECKPYGKWCEGCMDICGCPATPLPATYHCSSQKMRYYHSDPNLPCGYYDKKTGGWFTYKFDENGGGRYVRYEKPTGDFTFLENDPDFESMLRRDDRGAGYYSLRGKFKKDAGYWNKRRGDKEKDIDTPKV